MDRIETIGQIKNCEKNICSKPRKTFVISLTCTYSIKQRQNSHFGFVLLY